MSDELQGAQRNTGEDMKVYRSIDYSGFFERLFARIVDLAVAAGIGYLIYKKAGLIAGAAAALGFDLFIRIIATYFLGGTIGKLLFGVRVISRHSRKLSIWQVIIRESSRYISAAFLDFGYISIIFSRRKRAWHDIAAGTAVTSGGREEARYARDVYGERPERWNVAVWAPVTVILIFAILLTVNKTAFMYLNNYGMIGLSWVTNSKAGQYEYTLPSKDAGPAGTYKNIIQVGDINGDGTYETFREGIKDGKVILNNLRLSGSRPSDGDIVVPLSKPIIQYRLLDINGDKSDELAVLLEDKTLKLYKFEDGIKEIGSLGPVEYKEINAFIKGKPADVPYRLYILGDKNKVSIISMSKDSETKEDKIVVQKFVLPGDISLAGLDMGVFSKKNYLVGLTEDNNLMFYHYDGEEYSLDREIQVPIKGKISFAIKDINMDGVNEILVSSLPYNDEKNHVLAAYSVKGDSLKLMWDGGRKYKFKDRSVTLTMDDGGETDRDKSYEAYMVSKTASGQKGSLTLYLFEGDKYMFKLNDFLRVISFSKPR